MNNGQAANGLLGDLAAIDWDAPSGECAAIAEAWADVRDLCLDENPDGLAAVEARLAREWALDVAATERLVDVDRSVAFRLALNGFDAAGRDAAGAGDMEQWDVDVLSLLRDLVLWLLDRLDDEDENRLALDPELLAELHRRLFSLEQNPGGDEQPEAEDTDDSAEALQRVIDAIPPPGQDPPPELVAAWLLHAVAAATGWRGRPPPTASWGPISSPSRCAGRTATPTPTPARSPTPTGWRRCVGS